MKNKKTTWIFFFYKYGKFWSISPEQKVERKPLLSEEYKYTLVSCVHHLLKNKVHPLQNVLRIDVFCHRVETITLVRDSYLNLTEDNKLPWHTVSIAIVMRKKVMIYGANNFLVSVLSWHADYRYYIT